MTICESIKKRYIRLSKGQRKVAQYVIDNPNIVATQVASEVGRLAGVSESTVIRFCYAMNLSGYSELQEKMKQHLLDKDGVVPVMPKTRTSKRRNIQFNDVLSKDMKELLAVMQQADEQQCNQAVKMIHEAKEIYVVGFQSALPVAFSFYYELSKLRARVHMLQYDATKIKTDIMHMSDASTVVMIHLDAEQEDAIAVAELAKRKKATIVTLINIASPKMKQLSSEYFVLNKDKQVEDGTIAMFAFLRAFTKCLVAQFEESYDMEENERAKSFVNKLIEVS